MSEPDVLIVGVGPAGLAAGAELGRLGVPSAILERVGRVAWSWRGRYDRLRLNTCQWTSALPGGRYPDGTALFPSRDELVAYLESYAAAIVGWHKPRKSAHRWLPGHRTG